MSHRTVSTRRKIFVTGISGCVGHYLFDRLLDENRYHLHLLVRDPRRLRFDLRRRDRVEVIVDGLEHIERHGDLLQEMDAVVHLAARWGGPNTFVVNLERTLSLFSHLDPRRCRRVIYFSTASILDADNRPDANVERHGGEYLRSKYRCLLALEDLAIHARVVTLFPTVILGGDDTHPPAHASREIEKAWKYLRLIRFLTVDGSFHFIHAHDLAAMAAHILDAADPPRAMVAGQPAVTVDDCLTELCRIAGLKRRRRFDASFLVDTLIPRIGGGRLSAWDRYALRKKHFTHRVTRPETLGLHSAFPALSDCLAPPGG